MKKHAYLIMTHNSIESLKHLLQVIDDERNDIFLHIDKKMQFLNKAEIASWVKHSNIYFAKRGDIKWGHISLTMCEVELVELATKTGNYHYYHIISGVDFPIKSQDYIHSQLENENSLFISYHKDGEHGDNYMYKVQYYFPLMRFVGRGYHDGPGKKKAFLRWLTIQEWKNIDRQRSRGVDRTKKYPGITFYKGDNWFSIPDDFARYLVANKRQIKKMFAMTNGPDEFVMQTMALNSQFKERVKNESLRTIDWNRGNPYEYKLEDYNELIEKKEFFARKISYVNEPLLVNKLSQKLTGECAKQTEKNPLVSIVVPIYNVKDYLSVCLDSIKNQTYKNIQVLLVDDGSTDGSSSVAKGYAADDERFIYIRQQNAGLSGARNTGKASATGEYIAFIDSDDWLEPDYVNRLTQKAMENDADIVVCGFQKNSDVTAVTTFKGEEYLSKTKAMEVLGNIFTPEYLLINVAWNKLYKRSIFDKVDYPVGKIHEDEYSIHHIIDKADLIVTIPDVLYHYRIREDSITGSTNNENFKHFDIAEAHLDRVAHCRNQMYESCYRLIVYSLFEEIIQLMFRYSDDVCIKHKLYSKFRWLMLRESLKNYNQLDTHQKKEYLLMILSPRAYRNRVEKISQSKNS